MEQAFNPLKFISLGSFNANQLESVYSKSCKQHSSLTNTSTLSKCMTSLSLADSVKKQSTIETKLKHIELPAAPSSSSEDADDCGLHKLDTCSCSDDSTSNSIKKTIESQIQSELASLEKCSGSSSSVPSAKKRKSDAQTEPQTCCKVDATASKGDESVRVAPTATAVAKKKKKKNKKKKKANGSSVGESSTSGKMASGVASSAFNFNVNSEAQSEQEKLEKQLIEQQKLQQEQIEQLQKQIDEIADADSEEGGLLETALNENDFNKVNILFEFFVQWLHQKTV